MNRVLAIIMCVACLCGCASDGIHRLTYHQSLLLVKAVDSWAVEGGPAPLEAEKLRPLQIYTDHGNVVIVLQRDARGEKGYYIIPSSSSFDPRFRSDKGWTLTRLDYFDPYLDSIFKYSRTY
jgi:hypothetical protein